MKIIHLVPSIDDEASGPSYSVVRLSSELNKQKCNSYIYTLGNNENNHEAKIYYFKRFPIFKKFGFSFKLFFFLMSEAKSNNKIILHSHGLWMFSNILPYFLNKIFKVKYVSSVRGTLSKWSFNNNKYRKLILWHLIQKRVLYNSDILHATSQMEQNEIRSYGFLNKIFVSPNGMDINKNFYNLKMKKQILFLSRIHKKKGIEDLIDAWETLSKIHKDWKLVIVGPKNKYSLKLEKKILLNSIRNISFIGALYGKEKFQMYSESQLYILPTFSENFGVTVAEALSVGTPVIVTRNAPWEFVKKYNAGYWIKGGKQDLIDCINKFINLDASSKHKMKNSALSLIEKEFKWSDIAESMIDEYLKLN
jgi:glycosyltransferase involved in cell wall biosynthesis